RRAHVTPRLRRAGRAEDEGAVERVDPVADPERDAGKDEDDRRRVDDPQVRLANVRREGDRKSTRLNSSHTEIYSLSLHDALPIWVDPVADPERDAGKDEDDRRRVDDPQVRLANVRRE